MQKFTDEQLEAAGWLLIYKQLPPLATPVLALTEGGVADVCKMEVEGLNLSFFNAFRPQHSTGDVIAWKPLGLPEEIAPKPVDDSSKNRIDPLTIAKLAIAMIEEAKEEPFVDIPDDAVGVNDDTAGHFIEMPEKGEEIYFAYSGDARRDIFNPNSLQDWIAFQAGRVFPFDEYGKAAAEKRVNSPVENLYLLRLHEDSPELQRAALVEGYLYQIKRIVDFFRAGSAGARSSMETIHGVIERFQQFGAEAPISEENLPVRIQSKIDHMEKTLTAVSKFIAAHLEESETVAPAIHEIKELLYRRGFYPPNKPE